MKKFVTKCIAFFLILVLIFVPFNVLLDPYNVFHADGLVNNGVEPNKNYIKMRHVIKNPDLYDSLLFGSSRVGFLDVERMNDGTYYDMMYSEGLPAEHLQNLKDLIARGIVPKNILLGVDDISWFVDPEFHNNILYRAPFPWSGDIFDKAGFYLKYFDLITTRQSIKTIREHVVNDEEWSDRLLRTGTENLDIPSQFDIANDFPYWADYYMPREEVFEEIQEFIDLCEEYDIRLTVFTNPLFHRTYTKGIENGYLEFLKGLSEITDFYNFSGYNNLTVDMDNYYENSHYTRKIGDKMIDVMFYGKTDVQLMEQGFGVYVEKGRGDALLKILKDQAVNYGIEINTYKDTLNKSAEEY